MSALRRLFRFSLTEWSALLRATGWLLVVRMALWIVPFRHVMLQLQSLSKIGVYQKNSRPDSASELMRAIRRASRMIPAATCLTQTLAGFVLLTRAGYLCTMRFGVSKIQNGLVAHAWLDMNGVSVIGGAPEAAFSQFPPFVVSTPESVDCP